MARRKIKMMTRKPEDFRKALMREAEVAVPTYIRETVAWVVQRVYYGVLLSTPVLTGRARVNWMLTTTAPSRRTIDAQQSISEPGHWFSVTGQSFSSGEKDAIRSVMESIRKGPLGRRIFLTNNLQYINILEDGIGSSKAPFGMVEITLDWVQQLPQRTIIHRLAMAAT